NRQIVRRKKLTHRLGFLCLGSEEDGNLCRLEPMTIIRRSAIVERLRECIELATVMGLQPDAYFNHLCRIFSAEVLPRRDKARCIVRDKFAAHRTRRQQRATHCDYRYNK